MVPEGFVMSRPKRIEKGMMLYHVSNHTWKHLRVFGSKANRQLFVEAMSQVQQRVPVRIVSYCILKDHWHILLWMNRVPRLSEFMKRLLVMHSQRWHSIHNSLGGGTLYTGRYKSFPVQKSHCCSVMRFIESHPVRSGEVDNPLDWEFGSYFCRYEDTPPLELSQPPNACGSNYRQLVKRGSPQKDLAAIRNSIKRGAPYGDPAWVARTAKALELESTLRRRGRPSKK